MDWQEAVKRISPYVVGIATEVRIGTGFICRAFGETVLIVTARHVIVEAQQSNGFIEITKEGWPSPLRLLQPDRTIVFSNLSGSDAAIIFIESHILLPLKPSSIPFISWDKPLTLGEEVAWLGFPDLLTPRTLCLFSGVVSSKVANQPLIDLIDGTGIQGVSGGPIFRLNESGIPCIVGVVSKYLPHIIRLIRQDLDFPDEEREAEFTIPGLMQAESLYSFAPIVAAYENALEAAGEAIEMPNKRKWSARAANANQRDARSGKRRRFHKKPKSN